MSLELSGTTGVKGVAGSVSAPSIVGDDTNTGISFPSADTIKFSTGGVERMQITNSGVSGTLIGAGKVLQKVHQQSTTSQTTSGATKLDVLTLSITPASSSNQILLLAQLSAYMIPSNSVASSGVYIYRGGSAGSGTNVSHSIFWDNDANGTYANHGLAIIDTPNTTSATTYHLTLARQSGNTNTVSTDGYTYSLIALELAA